MTQESSKKYHGLLKMHTCGLGDDFGYESSETLHEARPPSEWCQNLSSGVPFHRMVNELFHHPPEHSQDFVLYSSFSESISQRPDLGSCQTFADTANSILLRYYSNHPPTVQHPAILFLPTSKATLGDGDPGSRILVVLRDQWDRIGHEHTHPQTKRHRRRDPATEVRPPWEIVVAVLEFGRYEVPAPYTPPPSLPNDTSDYRGRKRSRPTSEDLSLTRPPKIRRVGSSSHITPCPQTQEEHVSIEECSTHSSPRTSVEHSLIQPDPEAGLLGCFRQLLTGVTYRGWALGAIIEDRQISLVSCDRGGLVRSSPLDMRSSEGFQLLCEWVLTLGSRTMEQWGFTDLFGNIGKPVQDAKFDVPLTNLHLSLGRLRYRQRGIFGRCTNVYNVTVKDGDMNIESVCKIAWPLSSMPNEHKLLQKVHAIDPSHTPTVHCGWDVLVELPSKRLRPHCTDAAPIDERTMRVTIMTKYQPIDDLNGDDFLSAFTQIMKFTYSCNIRLVEAGCVHHQDLSPGNMMYSRDKAGQVIAILTDFDLAVSLDEPVQEDTGRRTRHGTAPFMPHALQLGDESEYTLEHDFEAAFYILLWVAMGYKCGKLAVGDPLREWREDCWKEIAVWKLAFVGGLPVYHKAVKLVRPEYKCLLGPIEKVRAMVNLAIKAKTWPPDWPLPAPPTSEQFFECLGGQ